MKRKFACAALLASAAALLAAPFLAGAQAPIYVPPPTTSGPVSSAGGIVNLINQILFWVATIFWIAAALFIFYAGLLYLTAGGDAEKITKAGHQLLYAVIAIVIGLMAYGLPLLLANFLKKS